MCLRLWKDVQRPQGFYKTSTAALNWSQWCTTKKSHSPPTFLLTSTPCIHPRRVLRFMNFHASRARREIFSAWLSCSILWMERRRSLPASISKFKAKNPQSKAKVSGRKSLDSTVDISNILWFRVFFSSLKMSTVLCFLTCHFFLSSTSFFKMTFIQTSFDCHKLFDVGWETSRPDPFSRLLVCDNCVMNRVAFTKIRFFLSCIAWATHWRVK